MIITSNLGFSEWVKVFHDDGSDSRQDHTSCNDSEHEECRVT